MTLRLSSFSGSKSGLRTGFCLVIRSSKDRRPSSACPLIRARQHLAFVRWTSNDFVTVLSWIDILRAAAPSQRYSTVPWINPGGEKSAATIWLGKGRARSAADRCGRGTRIDPADAAPDYRHHVHNRPSVNEAPRTYTRGRHRAWLHRRKVTS